VEQTSEELKYQKLCDEARTGGKAISADQIFVSAQRPTIPIFTPFSPVPLGSSGDRMLAILNEGQESKPGGGNDGENS
jgi:hypothetical protein